MDRMKGGNGKDSYACNSSGQRSVFKQLQPLVNEFILSCAETFSGVNVIRVADFGCSSGPNTFLAISSIIHEISQTLTAPAEFEAYFNDLKTNDFNTLFLLAQSGLPYFFAGVPGSFFHRLFPKSSLHFALSTFALHFLSQVPSELVDRHSPAYNDKRVFFDITSKPAVLEVVERQAHKDLCNFLCSRAQELVSGGLLCIVTVGTHDHDVLSMEEHLGWYSSFAKAWNDLVTEGYIQQEVLSNFNFPIFWRRPSHITKAVEEDGNFTISRLGCEETLFFGTSSADRAHFLTMSMRAITHDMVCNHLDDPVKTDLLFSKMHAYNNKFYNSNRKLNEPLSVVVAFLRRI